MVNHLISAPSAGPHYLPSYSEPSEGVEGWRCGYKWDCNPDVVMYGDSSKNYKTPGLDYMLAYNVLWLECLQKNKHTDFFESDFYRNEKERDYSLLSGTVCDVLFKYGEVNIANLSGNKFQENIIIAGENNIILESEIEIDAGHTFELVTRPKLTLPLVEQLAGQ
jgi:hypothetical protein